MFIRATENSPVKKAAILKKYNNGWNYVFLHIKQLKYEGGGGRVISERNYIWLEPQMKYGCNDGSWA